MKKKKKILAIDDDKSFCLLMQNYIKKEPYELELTHDAKSFFHLYQVCKPELCIIDLNLEEKLGARFKLLQLVREKVNPTIPLLVISKRSSRQDIALALEVGANDFVLKPLDKTTFIRKLESLLGKKTPLPFFKFSQGLQGCEIDIEVSIREISEYGVIFSSPHYFARGACVEISDPFLQEVTGRDRLTVQIQKTWLENNCYFSSFEFLSDDRELNTKVRSWLNKNQIAKIAS